MNLRKRPPSKKCSEKSIKFQTLNSPMFLFHSSFGPLGTNTFLIACEKTSIAAIIDPAYQSAKIILKKVIENDLKVEKILLTHSHWDHFADASELKEQTKAKLYVHELDAKNIVEPGYDGLPLFIPIQPVEWDHLVKDEDTIEIGELQLKVIHTPGHSPGGVCYYIKDQNVLISGDTLFQGGIGNLSLPTAEEEKMFASLEKLKKLPPETKVFPGHGDTTTIGNELF